MCADLIEVVTWICLGALTSDDGITVAGEGLGAALLGLTPELRVLEQLGVALSGDESGLTAKRSTSLRPVDVVVQSRGIFSDSHPLLALVAAFADGRSTFRETVWIRRFGYVDELGKLGLSATVDSGTASIHGPWRPATSDLPLRAADLRAAAALCLAATVAPGRTEVLDVHHLARGYRDFAGTLRQLGAQVDDQHAEVPVGSFRR